MFVTIVAGTLWHRLPDRYEAIVDGTTMGTTFKVRITSKRRIGSSTHTELTTSINNRLNQINTSMSTWLDDSELNRFNTQLTTEPFEASEDLLTVLLAAQSVSEASNGAFDVTLASVVRAWGFGHLADEDPPSNADLALLLGHTGYEKLHIDPVAGTLVKAHPELTCDLSSIAKGFGVDAIVQTIRDAGFTDYMVEIGGEVRASGLNLSGIPWQIGIEIPDEHSVAVYDVISLDGQAMATSGDYRNFRLVDGVRLSHTIDGRNGRPITHNLASVTVIAENAMIADAYATAINVLGPDDGLALANTLHLPIMMLVRNEEDLKEVSTPWFTSMRATNTDPEASK